MRGQSDRIWQVNRDYLARSEKRKLNMISKIPSKAEGVKWMGSTNRHLESSLHRLGRQKTVGLVIVLLIVAVPVLLGFGTYLFEYSTPDEPYQTPNDLTWHNYSIPVGGVAEYRGGIKYVNSTSYSSYAGSQGFLLDIATPKSTISTWDVNYFYFGFSHIGSQGFRVNYTVYDPAGNLIYTEAANETSSIRTLSVGNDHFFFNLYSIVVVGAEGNYSFRITNVGQYAFNATLMLGYRQVGWTRPFFVAGSFMIVLGVADIIGILALLLHRNRKVD